eukprot:TRINITY_DN10812_c0_g1_i1.p1 TRINITY_DN10812_c0_g1~~TRINITY_DN10812_c0_g1_i1.p1  ORF type:complete len:802 (-),score=274.89 TRINITY_DN10812_c0_g1_i1:504-2909(-)
MRNLAQTGQYNWDLQRYLGAGGQTPSNATHLNALLDHILQVYQVEYAVVLGPDRTILESASGRNIGRPFNDSEGIVAAAANGTGAAVWTHSILSYGQLLEERPPKFRDRESQLDAAYKGAHPYETKADSLSRWVCMAVKEVDLETLEPRDPDAPPSGFLVIGDIVNGKSASTSLIGLTLGGMAGVYHRRVNAQQEMDKDGLRWLAASATDTAQLYARRGRRHTLQNTLTQGFDPYDALPDREARMDGAASRKDTDVTATIDAIEPYVAALRKWHPDGEIAAASGRPALALARALVVDAAVTHDFMDLQYSWLTVMVVVDLLALFLATWLFLAPLETMGRRVRSGQHVDIAFLKSLTKRRRMGAIIGAVAVLSLLLGIRIQFNARGNMEDGVRVRSALGPGSTMLAYRQGIDQAIRTGKSMQVCTALLTLLDNHNQPAFKDFLIRRLTKVEETIWVEMALLYDGSGNLLVAPHAHAMEGSKFDPSGIVNDTLANQMSYTRTALMSAADLAKLNPERLIDRYYNTTPISALHVDETGEDAMVRWASVPLWSKGPYDGPEAGDPLSGVLVIGDVVNGKTRILERANKMVSHGYSAVYLYNSTGQYQMAAGIMRTRGTLFDVDVPLPDTEWLDALRLSTEWHADDRFTISKTLYFPKYGGKYVVSARCVNKNTVIDDDGSEVDPYDWRRQPIGDCTGYLVQGLPWFVVADILARGYSWQYAFVATCFAKLIAMLGLCYRAYLPFKRIIVSNKFVQSATEAPTPAASPPPLPQLRPQGSFNTNSRHIDTGRSSGGRGLQQDATVTH